MGKRMMLPLEGASSTLRVAIAQAVARSLTVGFDECSETGRALQQAQRASMIESAILVAADAMHDGEEALRGEAMIDTALRRAAAEEAR